jgi:allantoicase
MIGPGVVFLPRRWYTLIRTVIVPDANLKRWSLYMKTMPLKCKDVNAVRAFCDCIADADSVDVAAKSFCERTLSGNGKNVTGEDLAELKKALIDLENPGD